MNRRFPIGLVIAIFLIVGIGLSLRFFPPVELMRDRNVDRVKNAPSDLYASLEIRYDRPPIFDERYQMEDRNGTSAFSYTILRVATARANERETIKVPPSSTYEVSFFFGQLVNDGVWDVVTRPPRGNTSVQYTLTVRQTQEYQHGSHTVTFTDPHFWATTAGHEFHIHLSPKGPLPNILQLRGSGLRDTRYEQIVADFRNFGPPEFRAAIAKARNTR